MRSNGKPFTEGVIFLEKSKTKHITENKKARFNYTVEDEYEAGIVLVGTEVKSLREGRVNLGDAYADIVGGEVYIRQMHIGAYPFAYHGNHDPLRKRKLLMHKYEIKRLLGKVKERGYALIPLRLYFNNGKVKVKLGLCKGKRLFDKRETIKKRDEQRDLERSRKDRY